MESKHQELTSFNKVHNDNVNTQDNGQWLCPKCQSFNNISSPKCIICNLNDTDNDEKYIILETDCLEFTKCQSITEEISLIGSYIMVFGTIIFAIICVIIGTNHPNFASFFICDIIFLLIALTLLYLYNKYIPSRKQRMLCSSMIIVNGVDNEFLIYNSSETVILKCFHLERYGNKIFVSKLSDIQNIECELDQNNEMQFVIYYLDSNTQQNQVKSFGSDYFFCNQQWFRKVYDAMNTAKKMKYVS